MMEECEMTLQEYVAARRPHPLEPFLFWHIAYQCADGLRYLHSYNILHRDITPSNVMIAKRAAGSVEVLPLVLPFVKLDDFGISTFHFDASQASTLTASLGTKGYMAPEVYSGKYSTSSDVYSLGKTFLAIAPDLPVDDMAFLQGMIKDDASVRPSIVAVIAFINKKRRPLRNYYARLNRLFDEHRHSEEVYKAEQARREQEHKFAQARREEEHKAEQVRREQEYKAAQARREEEHKAEQVRREQEYKAAQARREEERKAEQVRREQEYKAAQARREEAYNAEQDRLTNDLERITSEMNAIKHIS